MKTIPKYFNKQYITVLLCSVILMACKKNPIVTPPTFNVVTDSITYKVNTPITFTLTGDADVITFYSGASGSQYTYQNRTSVTGTPQMQFTSYRQNGTQSNTIHLLVSKDFSNNFYVPDLQSANWTDITSRATFSTGIDNTASGIIDLSDFANDNKPINIAFKYTAIDTSVSRPTWTIKNIAISNKLADGTLAVTANSANINWGIVNVLGSQLWSTNTTQISISGGAMGTPNNEGWCITQQLFLNRVTPDIGVSIKSNPTTLQKSYTFPGYTTPGTYVVTFVAINASKYDNKQVIKQMTLTVK